MGRLLLSHSLLYYSQQYYYVVVVEFAVIFVVDQVYSAQMSSQLTLYVFEPLSSNDA